MTATVVDTIASVLGTYSTKLAQITRANEIPDAVTGFRPENDAEHSYELALVGLALSDRMDPILDRGLVARFAIVHDLEEIHCGDIPVFDPASESEARALAKDTANAQVLADLLSLSPAVAKDLQLYLERDCDEARFVYALDKILPFSRVLHNGRHHARPSISRYESRYATTRGKVAEYPQLLPVFEFVYREVRARLPELNRH